MCEKAWMSLSGRAVYRLRTRGNGVLRQLTRQERGCAELPLTEILPKRELEKDIGWVCAHSVPIGPDELAGEEWKTGTEE